MVAPPWINGLIRRAGEIFSLHASQAGQQAYASAIKKFLSEAGLAMRQAVCEGIRKMAPGRTRAYSVRAILWAAGITLLASSASAQGVPAISLGHLSVEPLSPTPCVDDNSFLQGQQVRLQGDGFAAESDVRLQLWAGNDLFVPLGSIDADPAGHIDTVITILVGGPVPDVMLIDADGSAPTDFRSLTKMINVGPAVPPDGDGDGIPDFCDTCPAVPNPGQEDDDGDGAGNACDVCPLDTMNDSDGDGLCSAADACPLDADNDIDADGVCGDLDNCPDVENELQEDSDVNGIGDACQTSPQMLRRDRQ